MEIKTKILKLIVKLSFRGLWWLGLRELKLDRYRGYGENNNFIFYNKEGKWITSNDGLL